jgi:hypothetical protein
MWGLVRSELRLSTAEVPGELSRLKSMPLRALRDFWRERWGFPPRFQSAQMLRLLIAWRLQTETWGGLDKDTRTRLRRTGTPRPAAPPPGTRLIREYKGVLHHIEVEPEGFRYRDVLYDNLSQVAEVITGTHWNGPRFFGLRGKKSGE